VSWKQTASAIVLIPFARDRLAAADPSNGAELRP
jgi:hypothetical protein